MDNYSTKKLNSNRNEITAPQSYPAPPFPWSGGESNDWDLRQFLGIIQRRALIIVGVTTVVMGIVTHSALQQKPIYQGNFQLLVEPVNEYKSLGKVLNQDLNQSSLDYPSQIQVLMSPELMENIVNKLHHSYPGINYNNLLQALSIRRLGDTKIIEVSYQSHDPKKIKVVLDQIAETYLNYSLEKRQTKLRQGVQFVDKQLPIMKNRVDQIQQELQLFRQKYEFINPESQAEQTVNLVKTLADQRMAVEQQLTIARANFNYLEGQQGQLAALNNAPVYQQLLSQLRQIEVQISGELTRFQAGNPAIQTLEEKKQNLLPLLEAEAQRIMGVKFAEVATQIQLLEVQRQELANTEQQARQKIQQLPILARKYNELQRDLQIATESLNRFLTTRQTLQIEVAQTELPWELIKAVNQPEIPISPNIQRNLISGLFVSLIAGIAIGLLLEKLDNTYHNIETLKQKIKLPILGILPFDKHIQTYQKISSNKQIAPNKLSLMIPSLSNIFRRQVPRYRYYGQGKFWESLQVLYTNIQLLNSDQPIRSLVISSALPGDGKSTVAMQLAQIATAMGKRVLLVDADLRRPQIHKLADLNNLWGLSTLISTYTPIEQVIRQMPTINELSVITSGPVPPDPARLLSSVKMKQLMAYCQQKFDLVIYDVPPLVGLVDVRLIAPHTDGMIMVVRLDKTDKSGLMQAQDSLKLSSINVLGIVANGDKTNFSGYNYYYGLSHRQVSNLDTIHS